MYSENYTRDTARANADRAADPSLTDHELATLARSEEAQVRAVVAARPETPLTALLRMVEDDAPAVRAGLARNPRVDMPEDIHLQLMKDKSPEVVHALIRNGAVPDSIIGKIARGRNKEYVAAARARLSAKGTKAKVLGMVGIATR